MWSDAPLPAADDDCIHAFAVLAPLAMYHTFFHLFIFTFWLKALRTQHGIKELFRRTTLQAGPVMADCSCSHHQTGQQQRFIELFLRHRATTQSVLTAIPCRMRMFAQRVLYDASAATPVSKKKVFIRSYPGGTTIAGFHYHLLFTSHYTHCHLLCDLPGVTGATVGCYGFTTRLLVRRRASNTLLSTFS